MPPVITRLTSKGQFMVPRPHRRVAGTGESVEGQAHSLEAPFADAPLSEDEADELLVEGDWEEAEAPREPIPFPVRPGSAEIGTLNDLPLFAINGTVSAPVSALANGKVVTLEELAQMVRWRKPRPKAVPEGRFAPFAS